MSSSRSLTHESMGLPNERENFSAGEIEIAGLYRNLDKGDCEDAILDDQVSHFAENQRQDAAIIKEKYED